MTGSSKLDKITAIFVEMMIAIMAVSEVTELRKSISHKLNKLAPVTPKCQNFDS